MNLRPATMRDAARLYHWRVDPQTVEASLLAPPKNFTAHCGWLLTQLHRPDIRIFIGHDNQRSLTVGMCRLELLPSGDVIVVSVAVDPLRHGYGYGSQLVAASMLAHGLSSDGAALGVSLRFRATVKATNYVSLRLFWALGFELAETQTDPAVIVLEKREE
jgi:ribosomal protein S18 acetylase RimI-like enzyme